MYMTIPRHACPAYLSALLPYTAGKQYLRSSGNSIDFVDEEIKQEQLFNKIFSFL
jgi:hypothetical protein